MNKHGDYVVELYNMKDKIVEHDGKRYVFIPVISQRLKHINSEHTATVYRRWFQLIQFTLNVVEVYGVPALDIDSQVRKGHTSSIHIHVSNASDTDYITLEK